MVWVCIVPVASMKDTLTWLPVFSTGRVRFLRDPFRFVVVAVVVIVVVVVSVVVVVVVVIVVVVETW